MKDKSDGISCNYQHTGGIVLTRVFFLVKNRNQGVLYFRNEGSRVEEDLPNHCGVDSATHNRERGFLRGGGFFVGDAAHAR
jgi:hypothetical protein